ncbi:tyrosyl-DNA phosphodiesterase-domain-containing protein [Roridomyces roridus]|uniref:Tyrosyl-DNA phosphodiesterase-domain-containing protein n=1 Tax=Roridomyces roridus TaxID=1738132 RepID=A0AAD7B9W2_9AGAR|nr:tyrosyl-DNA phosphodiesterase-domain-containing protein [Roridomyces roridus]
MESEDDADFARAIALSLEDKKKKRPQSPTKRSVVAPKRKAPVHEHEVVVISSDEDEEPIVEVSRPKKPLKISAKPEKKAEPSPPPPPAIGAGPLSLLGDRAQMERERLARQKRLRGPSPPPTASSADDDDEDVDESGSEGSARKRARLDASGSAIATKTAAAGGRRTFPTGAILRIETRHAERAETPGIRLTEILGPREDIEFAIISSYCIDLPWFYAFFDPATPVVLVGDPKLTPGADVMHTTLKNVFPNWVRVCPALANTAGHGCMHMKFMLLFSKSTGAIRVVVSTANLIQYDWRDMENYVYIQDVAKATPGRNMVKLLSGEKPGESFPAVLAGVLRGTGVEEALTIMLQQGHTSLPIETLGSGSSKTKSVLETGWDWTQGRAALVPSVAGKWEGWAGTRPVVGQGQTRLMRAVQTLGCALDQGGAVGKGKGKGKAYDLELDCLGSSIGTYSAPWLAAFRLCAAGRSTALQSWLDRSKKKVPAQTIPLRLLFPTLETIRNTKLGEPGGGTLFCRRTQWGKMSTLAADEGAKFEVRDARSRSGPVAMHTKMILGTLRLASSSTGKDEEEDSVTEDSSDDEIEVIEPKKPHAWIYVGSHNFTPSAWGNISGSGFNPVLNISNYELGVVLRLETPADADGVVAWERPARKYARGDVPWMQEESPFHPNSG